METPLVPGEVVFLAHDKPITVPIVVLDERNDALVSVSINYSVQMGACCALLLVLLLMTPATKLRRPLTWLHVSSLVVCVVRLALLTSILLSPFHHFYPELAQDHASVPWRFICTSVAADIVALLFVVLVQATLVHQAWTMVSLWPSHVRNCLGLVSALVSLLTVGWGLAFAVVQIRCVLELRSLQQYAWLAHSSLILNALSICWFCALFNTKLVIHLLAHRGILARKGRLTPMDILVMTNGLLMVVPVIFAGLEWGSFTNFEAASITDTSVALVLPLGSLAAQQIVIGASSLSFVSSVSGNNNNDNNNNSNNSNSNSNNISSTSNKTAYTGRSSPSKNTPDPKDNNITEKDKFPSVSTACSSATPQDTSLLSSSDTIDKKTRCLDHYDLELLQIDSSDTHPLDHQVRVDTDLEQRETRI